MCSREIMKSGRGDFLRLEPLQQGGSIEFQRQEYGNLFFKLIYFLNGMKSKSSSKGEVKEKIGGGLRREVQMVQYPWEDGNMT